jgi:hypothetical protein
LTAVANRYASQQREHSSSRTWFDLVVACAPMTSLATGLGLGAAGYLLDRPGVAACGTVVCAVGLYVERLQARSLRRRRRAERLRNRHEVTELRRTIAQLRLDVGAFQRALHDTEAAVAARTLPLPPPIAAPVVMPATPVAAPVATPVATQVPEADLVVVPIADVEAREWIHTPRREAGADLPAQHPSPFVATSGALPIVAPVPERRAPRGADVDTGGIPVLDPRGVLDPRVEGGVVRSSA